MALHLLCANEQTSCGPVSRDIFEMKMATMHLQHLSLSPRTVPQYYSQRSALQPHSTQ